MERDPILDRVARLAADQLAARAARARSDEEQRKRQEQDHLAEVARGREHRKKLDALAARFAACAVRGGLPREYIRHPRPARDTFFSRFGLGDPVVDAAPGIRGWTIIEIRRFEYEPDSKTVRSRYVVTSRFFFTENGRATAEFSGRLYGGDGERDADDTMLLSFRMENVYDSIAELIVRHGLPWDV